MTAFNDKLRQITANKEFRGTIIAIAVFAITSLIYFIPDAFEGNVLRQHDTQQGIALGHEISQYENETGELSRWTNSVFSGMPTFQISPRYESSTPVSWVGKILGLGLPSPVNLVFIMMLGFYILLKAVKMRWYIAIPGAIAWALSTYFIIIIGAGHIWKYITLSYIPPTIAGIIWAYRGKYITGSLVAALFATLQLAGNHIQMTYYSMFLILGLSVAYLVTFINRKQEMQWIKATLALLCAALLAVMANSPNLYNTYKYSKETMRGGHSELASENVSPNATKGGLDKDYITQWSYGKDELLTLLVPNAKGGAHIKPEKGNNLPLLLNSTKGAKEMFETGKIDAQTYQALGSFYQYFGDQPITNGPVYVGALIFALFIFGCIIVKGPIKWAVVIVTFVTVLLSLGHNMMWFTDLFIDYFPMYNKFRTVSSILIIAELTMPLLAMMGLQKLLLTENGFKEYAKALYISFGVSGFLCLILLLAPSMLIGNGFPEGEYSHYAAQGLVAQYPQLFDAIANVRFQLVKADALRSVLILILGLAVILLFGKGKISYKLAAGVLALIILIDLFSVNKRYLNSDSFTAPVAQNNEQFTPRPVDLKILQDTTMNYRVMDMTKFSEAMPSYFHRTIGGYHAAKLSRYQDIIDKHIAGDKGLNFTILNMLNAKYIITDDNNAEVNSNAMGNAWFVEKVKFVDTPDEEISALYTIQVDSVAVADRKFAEILTSGAKSDNDTIFETSYAPNRLTYHYTKVEPGVAVFSEVYFPWGWEATIDGVPAEIGRVNYILRALTVPAGEHNIEFVFKPKSVTMTETLAFISIAIIYIGLITIVLLSIFWKKDSSSTDAKCDIVDE